MADLFERVEPLHPSRENMATGAVVLYGNALAFEDALLAALQSVTAQAPFRHMVTPGGFPMSVSMTNCGAVGWVTDRTGYRYDRIEPRSGLPWPPLPEVFGAVASAAAADAGYPNFVPDACLINRYKPGARLSRFAGGVALRSDRESVFNRSYVGGRAFIDRAIDSAARLCHAEKANITLLRDGTFHYLADVGFSSTLIEHMHSLKLAVQLEMSALSQ
jgi:hypothetical protein